MRARNIKPGFFKNDVLAECSLATRLLFVGLWTLADREGRLEDRPKRIKGEVFPYENFNVDELMDELQAHGFIIRYSIEGGRFVWIPAFTRHQNPHKQEKESKLPAYPGENPEMTRGFPNVPPIAPEITGQLPNEHPIHPADSPYLEILKSESPNKTLSPKDDGVMKDENPEAKELPSPQGTPAKKPVEMTLPLLVEGWNKMMVPLGFPKVRELNEARKKNFRTRLKENPERASTAYWYELFKRISGSDFLSGRIEPQQGRRKFVCRLPWLLDRAEALSDILEGKYDNNAQAQEEPEFEPYTGGDDQ